MKRIIVTLAVLLLAVPALATVTITVDPGAEPNTVVVGFTSDEGQLVRALALDVQVSDPCAYIADVNCVSTGYKIHPGSIDIDAGGNVTDEGTCAGVLDGNTMTSEQGSLYVGAGNAPAPGDLFIITLGGCTLTEGGDVVVSVSPNVLRGGVVMEDAGAPTALDTSDTATVNVCELIVGCPCLGDVSGPLGVPDGAVSTSDMGVLLGIIGPVGPPYIVPIPTGMACLDLSGPVGVPDGVLSTSDMGVILGHIGPLGPPFVGGCIPGSGGGSGCE